MKVICTFDPQVRKKAFIENTVPLIISLKNLLEQKRSPVLRDLVGYLQVSPACMIIFTDDLHELWKIHSFTALLAAKHQQNILCFCFYSLKRENIVAKGTALTSVCLTSGDYAGLP